MDSAAIEQAFTLFFQNNIWKSIIIAGGAYVTMKLLTNVFNILLSYLLVKLDGIGIGTPVEYKGKSAIIQSIGLTRIILETDTQLIFIRIQDWRTIDLVMQKQLK